MISLIASAIRPKLWGQFLKSLEGNKCDYEVIFVGNVPPHIKDGGNPKLKWIESDACPAECYQIGFNHAIGNLIHWTADDAVYTKECLDVIWTEFNFHAFYGNTKLIFEPLLYENYGKGWKENSRTQKFNSQRFSPLMAPFGFM